jgi:hypothetical protein
MNLQRNRDLSRRKNRKFFLPIFKLSIRINFITIKQWRLNLPEDVKVMNPMKQYYWHARASCFIGRKPNIVYGFVRQCKKGEQTLPSKVQKGSSISPFQKQKGDMA